MQMAIAPAYGTCQGTAVGHSPASAGFQLIGPLVTIKTVAACARVHWGQGRFDRYSSTPGRVGAASPAPGMRKSRPQLRSPALGIAQALSPQNNASALPLFHAALPRWQQLITPAWLARLVAGASVSAAPANGWRLLEVDCGAPSAFLQSHIPGAAYLDTQCLEEGPFWNKVSDSALLQLLLSLGIRHDTTVILYGRNTTAAARAAHLMLYAGVKDVRLLDGGFTEIGRAHV